MLSFIFLLSRPFAIIVAIDLSSAARKQPKTTLSLPHQKDLTTNPDK